MVKLTLETPNGTSLVGTQTYPQLEESAKAQILEMIPDELIADMRKQENTLILKNGHRILFRSFDDETKIRSLNLCFWWIEEGSTVDYSVFSQLQARLRNSATTRHRGLISTNPDINWIKTDFLLVSDQIHGTNEVYHQEEINPAFSTHIAPTHLNIYLPDDYIETVSANKPTWWKNRYINGSFTSAEGQVYPNIDEAVIPAFDIWQRIKSEGWYIYTGADFGLRDPTVFLMVAIDPYEGMAYVFDEYVKTDEAVPYHAKQMNTRLARIPHGLHRRNVGDPSGKRKNQADNRSIFDHYREYGIFFSEGDNRLDAGIFKVHAYLSNGRLKIFDTLTHTIWEHRNYRYKEPSLDSQKNLDADKPVDKDNHTVDTLRYIIQELPDNPDGLKTEMARPNHAVTPLDKHLPFALQEDDVAYQKNWYNYY